MIVASVNANKRLGGDENTRRFRAWLRRHSIDMVLVQEAWRPTRLKPVPVPGMSFVDGDGELAVWTRGGVAPPRTERPASWWQVVRVGDTAIHSVHLDPYAATTRVQQLDTLAAGLRTGEQSLVVGDFNLAPRPVDGLFDGRPSGFTAREERDALVRLLKRHTLTDSTATETPVYTISRTIRGARSEFRCDLALVPASIPPAAVTVSSETRLGHTAFTDHAGLVVRLDEELVADFTVEAAPDQQSLFDLDTLDQSAPAATAAYKTAMRRRAPSAPAVASLGAIVEWASLDVGGPDCGDLLDFGCGTGADVRHYRELGLDAVGYDPHEPFGFSEQPNRQFKVVTLMFVLNVIPTVAERLEALRSAASFLVPGGRLVVATRSPAAIHEAADRGDWRAWGDGFVSHEGRSTFQHGLDEGEIRGLGAQVGLRPAEEFPRVQGASLVALAAVEPTAS